MDQPWGLSNPYSLIDSLRQNQIHSQRLGIEYQFEAILEVYQLQRKDQRSRLELYLKESVLTEPID